MPEIESTELSTEELQQQTETRESLHANVLDKIKSADVFKTLEQDLPSKDVGQRQQQPPQEPEEEQTEEGEQQEETQEDEQEEVVPKSKIQPRIDQLTARLRAQQAEIDSLKSQNSTPKDDIQRQLDEMTEDALEDSLTQVRVAKEKARDDESKLMELVKLERRIEKTIVQAPQKFVQRQVNEANATVQRLVSEGEVNNDNYPKVLEIAKSIYEKYPKMQKTIDGQSMAIELAIEHYKQISKTSSTKVDTQNLKGQINTLKKKTALDTKNVKGAGDKVNVDKLRSNAMNGSMKDKERYAHSDPRFKIDAMIPDFLKG